MELRFSIAKTEEEWIRLQSVINTKRNGKNNAPHGNGLNGYLAAELHTHLKSKKCDGEPNLKLRKSFAINVPDDMANELMCQASSMGMKLGAFINKIIIEPKLR